MTDTPIDGLDYAHKADGWMLVPHTPSAPLPTCPGHVYEPGGWSGEECCTVCNTFRHVIESHEYCAIHGHRYFEGRCASCRTYQPNWLTEGRSDAEFDSETVAILSDPTDHCPLWTADQGCPLHGEACAAALGALR